MKDAMLHSDKIVENHEKVDPLMALAERLASRNRKAVMAAEIAIALAISTVLFWSLSQKSWQSEGIDGLDFAGIVAMATSMFVIEHLTYSDAAFPPSSRELIGLDLKSRLRFLLVGTPLMLLVLFESINPEGQMDTHSVALGMGLVVFPAVAATIVLDHRERRFKQQTTD